MTTCAQTLPDADGRRIMTVEDAYERSDRKIGKNFIRAEIKRGRLRAIRAGKRRLLIRLADWEAWLDSREFQPAPDRVVDSVNEQFRRDGSLNA